MTLIGLIVLVVIVGLLIWLVPQIPPPWRWITVAVLVIICIFVLLSLLGFVTGSGMRLR